MGLLSGPSTTPDTAPAATPDAPPVDTTAAPAVGALVSHTYVDHYGKGENPTNTVYGLVLGTTTDDDGSSVALVAWLAPGTAQLPVGDLTEL